MDNKDDNRLHDTIGFIGLRAQATAVGLLQLSVELRRAGVIDEEAINRIKSAIAREISLSRPRSPHNAQFDANLRERLDRLFAGEETLNAASPVSAGLTHE